MSLSTSMLSYTPAADRNAELREGLRQVARPGIGYRLARSLLLPQFGVLNHKRVYRLWKQERLSLKKRTKKKRRTGTKVPLSTTRANHEPTRCGASTSATTPA